eukprot:NODE_8_length_66115_cov_0.981823.p16 type:complete len:394 gc:universal NODE_8_length_66115_cov_0.981823:7880-9061(+)
MIGLIIRILFLFMFVHIFPEFDVILKVFMLLSLYLSPFLLPINEAGLNYFFSTCIFITVTRLLKLTLGYQVNDPVYQIYREKLAEDVALPKSKVLTHLKLRDYTKLSSWKTFLDDIKNAQCLLSTHFLLPWRPSLTQLISHLIISNIKVSFFYVITQYCLKSRNILLKHIVARYTFSCVVLYILQFAADVVALLGYLYSKILIDYYKKKLLALNWKELKPKQHDALFMILYWQDMNCLDVFGTNTLTKPKSLRDFWGKNWHQAFRSAFIFTPKNWSKHRVKQYISFICAFFVSGIFHEYEACAGASLNAFKGCDGRSFTFFMIQCLLVIIEVTFTKNKLKYDSSSEQTRSLWSVLTFISLIVTLPYFMDPLIESHVFLGIGQLPGIHLFLDKI